MKRIYWFAFYNINSPTVRYRGKYATDYLRDHFNIRINIILPAHNIATAIRFLSIYFRALLFPGRDSLIVIQSVYRKSLYPSLLKLLMRIRYKISVYDMDDADYLRYPPENIFWFIRNAAVVTLGSRELVKNLQQYNPQCTLITCPVPDLKIVKVSRNKLFTVGWIGDFQKTHKQSLLKDLFPALIQLPFEFKFVLLGVVKEDELGFIQKYFEGHPNIQLEMPQQIPWTDEACIQRRIVEFDVGIATLLDDEFSRSKSAFKLKQYLNNGVPVLSTNLAENNHFLKEGVNGYFCDSPVEYINRLVEFRNMDDVTYAQFSKNARLSVPEFDLNNFSLRLLETYNQEIKSK